MFVQCRLPLLLLRWCESTSYTFLKTFLIYLGTVNENLLFRPGSLYLVTYQNVCVLSTMIIYYSWSSQNLLASRNIKKAHLKSLREKCPNTEFFLVRIFLHWDWIRRDTVYLDTFHAVKIWKYMFNLKNICKHKIWNLSRCKWVM